MAWFLAPVPNNYGIWPNFRSPLLWDVFAVSTYFTVSVLFWYTGLVPDLATLRDRATSKIKKFFYGIFALGWRGSNRHWRHYEMAYLLLAGLSTPLVLSVHSVVSFDFATSIIPTWHTTIFPPYFVAGAIFGGFAMVLTLMIPARAIFKLHDIITPQHIDKMAKIILLTGSIVGYAYAMEFFIAWYSGNQYEKFAFYNRIFGPYWWYWWVGMLFCNALSPQLFWFKWCRRNIFVVYFVCMCVNAGMWFERFIIIVGGLHRDFLPSSWGLFHPDLGRHLDLRRHVRNFHFALPAFHSLPADDCDVGSEDRLAGSGSASRHAGGTSCRSRPAERSAHENAVRQSRFTEWRRNIRAPPRFTKRPSKCAMPASNAGMSIRRFRFMAWTTRWASANRGSARSCFAGGITGLLTACVLEFGPSSFIYPLIVHGKPFNFWTVPAFFPIMFELTVLFSAFAAFFACADHEWSAALESSDV